MRFVGLKFLLPCEAANSEFSASVAAGFRLKKAVGKGNDFVYKNLARESQVFSCLLIIRF